MDAVTLQALAACKRVHMDTVRLWLREYGCRCLDDATDVELEAVARRLEGE